MSTDNTYIFHDFHNNKKNGVRRTFWSDRVHFYHNNCHNILTNSFPANPNVHLLSCDRDDQSLVGMSRKKNKVFRHVETLYHTEGKQTLLLASRVC